MAEEEFRRKRRVRKAKGNSSSVRATVQQDFFHSHLPQLLDYNPSVFSDHNYTNTTKSYSVRWDRARLYFSFFLSRVAKEPWQ